MKQPNKRDVDMATEVNNAVQTMRDEIREIAQKYSESERLILKLAAYTVLKNMLVEL